MRDDEALSIRAYTYLPPTVVDAPRQPGRWDGRPFPGPCTVTEACPYQARGSMAHWSGGAPGVGEFIHSGDCGTHG